MRHMHRGKDAAAGHSDGRGSENEIARLSAAAFREIRRLPGISESRTAKTSFGEKPCFSRSICASAAARMEIQDKASRTLLRMHLNDDGHRHSRARANQSDPG